MLNKIGINDNFDIKSPDESELVQKLENRTDTKPPE